MPAGICRARNVTPARNTGRRIFPGARYFDIDAVADRAVVAAAHGSHHGAVRADDGCVGVSNTAGSSSTIRKGYFARPAAWWLLRLFGHEGSAVLDGGLPKWRPEQRAVEQGEALPRPVSTSYRATYNARHLRGIGDILANLTSTE